MNKSKPSLKRGSSKMKSIPSGDFIALGSKASRQKDISEIRLVSLDRKLDSACPIPAKRPKMHSSSVGSSSLSKVAKESGEKIEPMAMDSFDLVTAILEAEEKGEDGRIEEILCGYVRLLKQPRTKPDQKSKMCYSSNEAFSKAARESDGNILHLAKTKPLYFRREKVTDAFCGLLKREGGIRLKVNGNSSLSELAVKVLMGAYEDQDTWPELFVRIYIEDALGDRVWVDNQNCRGFVGGIVSAFDTIAVPEEGAKGPVPRYGLEIHEVVADAVSTHIHRVQPELSRNTFRLLQSVCGVPRVRVIVAQKMESWLNHLKMAKPAHDLLQTLCANCRHPQDAEAVSHLASLRLKPPKPLPWLKLLLSAHEDHLGTVIQTAVLNELSASRNPQNKHTLSAVFQHAPSHATQALARVFLDALLRQEDLKHLRVLLRDTVTALRHNLNLREFCIALLAERKEAVDLDLESKEKYFLAVVDLVVLSIFLGVSPAVKDVTCARGDKKDVLRAYRTTVAGIQRDAVWWLHAVVPNMFHDVPRHAFMHALRKLLFMEEAECYYSIDSWPPECDRVHFLRMASQVPVLEDTLVGVLLMGHSRRHPLDPPDCLDLTDRLVRRAASMSQSDSRDLVVDKLDLVDALFNLSVFHHPENIPLPEGFHAPSLAISDLYWKSWIILLQIVAHNPSSFGKAVCDRYPTLKCLVEMCITDTFVYPPHTLAVGEKALEMKNQEHRIALQEREKILEYETHLAAASPEHATITESNSHLLSRVVDMNPCGTVRKPPQSFLDNLRVLNQSMNLGHHFCSSRNPDFLLEIVRRQDTVNPMPWLAELVESGAGNFHGLPLQCLCEFFVHDPSTHTNNEPQRKKSKKQEEVQQYLQTLLHSPGEDPIPTQEILDYFTQRLNSENPAVRALAAKGLALLLARGVDIVSEDGHIQKVLSCLPHLPHFKAAMSSVCLALRQTCHVESHPQTVIAYVRFLTAFLSDYGHQEIHDLALNMARMIVDRSSLLNQIFRQPSEPQSCDFLRDLLNINLRYLHLPEAFTEELKSGSKDIILVRWSNGKTITLPLVLAYAMVILLSFGPPAEASPQFEELLEIWFPHQGQIPRAFQAGTTQELVLLPDWLKLRMVRSSVSRLVDAALEHLEIPPLITFIQSFGIPIASMSKLLCALDKEVEKDSSAVGKSIPNKNYMLQLLKVQNLRGAVGGDKLFKLYKKDHVVVEKLKPENTSVDQHESPLQQAASTPNEFLKDLSNLFLANQQSPGDLKDIFVRLRRTLLADAMESSTGQLNIIEFISACTQIMEQDEDKQFARALLEKYNFSLVLFKLCISSNLTQPLLDKMLWVMNEIVTLASGLRSPLLALAQDFVLKHSKTTGVKATISAAWRQYLQNFEDTRQAPTSDVLLEVVKRVKQEEPSRLEEAVKQIVKLSITQGTTEQIIAGLTWLTVDSYLKPDGPEGTLFVDFLEKLEPEMIRCCPNLQQQLLFSPSRLRPYLLGWVLHQSTPTTLRTCLHLALQHPRTHHPQSILDFLAAILLKYTDLEVHRDIELTPQHAKSVVEYILEEAGGLGEDSNRLVEILEHRMTVLLSCRHLDTVSSYLCHLIADNHERKHIAQYLLLLLYLRVPRLLNGIPYKFLQPLPDLFKKDSMMDVAACYLIISLASVTDHIGPKNEVSQRMPALELTCRKMAAVHSHFFLNQLSMIPALLRGRIIQEFHSFKTQNHLNLFSVVLSLLELLAPHAFSHPAFPECMGHFLDMFVAYIRHTLQPDLSPIVHRWISLLQDVCEVKQPLAQDFMRLNIGALEKLSAHHPKQTQLTSMLKNIEFQTLKRECSPEKLDFLSERLRIYSSRGDHKALGLALQQLAEIARRRPAALIRFTEELKMLIHSQNAGPRLAATKLMILLLDNHPGKSGECLEAVLQGLDSPSPEVASTVLDHLPAYVRVFQDRAGEILSKAFRSGLNAPAKGCEAQAMLNL